jgi:hypothetical protein
VLICKENIATKENDMKKLALILALSLGMTSLAPAQDAESIIVRDSAGKIVSIGGMAPAVAVALGVIVVAGVAFAVSQDNNNNISVTVTTTGTL